MAPAVFGTVYSLLVLIILPQVLAGPSCSHNYHGKPGYKDCRNHGGSGGYNIRNFGWGHVSSGSGGNEPHSIPSAACGSNTIPKNSGTSPTPKSTSTPPPPAVTPSTPTPTPGSPSPSPSPTESGNPTFSTPQVGVTNPSNQTVPASDSIKEETVNVHNNFRAEHGASPLTWNDTLADYAANWASGCVFEHSNGPFGENLAAGAPYTITAAVDWWMDEAKDYDPNNPQYSHFTQVVWKGTTSVGCVNTICPPGTIYTDTESNNIVCEYYPPGNVIGQFDANVQV